MITKIRPSKLGLAVKCPASARPAPEQEQSEAAERGTLLHTFLNPAVEIPETLTSRENWMLEAARAELLEISPDWIYPTEPINLNICGVELTGTPDAYCVKDGILYVADFKAGYNPVETSGNYQLGAYALALLEKHPEIKFARVKIVQPIFGKKEEWIQTNIDNLRRAITSAVEMIKANTAKELAGKHCDSAYCPHRQECGSYRIEAVDKITTAMQIVRSVNWKDLSNEEQADIEKELEQVVAKITALRKLFKDKAKAGGYGDLVELIEDSGDRYISDPAQAVKIAMENGVIFDDILKTISFKIEDDQKNPCRRGFIGLLRDAIRSKFKTRKESTEEAERLLNPVIARKNPSITIKIKGV